MYIIILEINVRMTYMAKLLMMAYHISNSWKNQLGPLRVTNTLYMQSKYLPL